MTNYNDDSTLDEQEALLDAQEARQYKMSARAAMNASMYRATSDFDSTFKRYMKRQKLLKSIQNGSHKPTNQIDYAKVAYTMSLQLANLTLGILLIGIGVWPLVILSVPAFLLYNYYWLLHE